MRAIFLFLALTTFYGSAVAEQAAVIRPSSVLTKPALNASTVASLAEGSQVEVISHQGGWSKIKTANGKTGFVRMLNLRLMQNSKTTGNNLNQLGNVIRTGSTAAVATTGVKGITKEALANATPNMQEVAKMEHYASNADKAAASAKAVKLSAKAVAYVEDKQ
ncbi:MAG: SH3 domain-containing protein [Methylotenera sp.]|jgi:flagellar basal body rod protein FlgF|nr:SH3 domain-containing protein [Methylotenera sp.]